MEQLELEIILLEKKAKNMPYGTRRREEALQKLKRLYEKLHHMYFS